MAEGGENPPVLSYVYKCESCRHEWRALSHQEIGLVCSECRSSRIRAPSKRGTYKYLCNECDFKWKKHNSTGGVGFCPKCNIGKYPYKFMPNYAPKRMFGEFVCSNCDRSWKSGNAWEGHKQQCQDCRTWNLPANLRPLRPPQFPLDRIQKPHPEDKCEKCKKLGYNCRSAPTASNTEDDESVISTSDSSIVFSGDREASDTTPVPSDHGSDVGDIDELVDEIEQLELK